jgi:hypothetical protein
MEHPRPKSLEEFVSRLAIDYVETGRGVPVHQARIMLQPFKGELDRLLAEGTLLRFGDVLFPGMEAFLSLSNPSATEFAFQSVELVLQGLYQLYSQYGPRTFTNRQVMSAVGLSGQATPNKVRAGMLLATEFKNYVEGAVPSFGEGADEISAVGIGNGIVDYQSVRQAWKEEQRRRASAKEKYSDSYQEIGSAGTPTKKPGVVFVSCGQVSDEEKELGRSVCGLIEQITPFRAYFAENQSSLQALTENILSRLNDCVGLVAIMHPRGDVLGLNGERHTRASVWIEQEVAICAFITQVLKRPMEAVAYLHKSIGREGMRSQLHLNPVLFESTEQILSDLRTRLASWQGSTRTRVSVSVRRQAEDRLRELPSHSKEALRLLIQNGPLTDHAAISMLQRLGKLKEPVISVYPGLQSKTGWVHRTPGLPPRTEDQTWELTPQIRDLLGDLLGEE